MLKSYRTDPAYLLKYYIWSTALLLVLIALLAHFDFYRFQPSPGYWIFLLLPLALNSVVGILFSIGLLLAFFFHYYGSTFHPWQLALVPFGIYLGMINVQLIHNCAHRSFRPFWINRPLGEFLALHLLSGFPGFVILHLTHHKHPDDPLLDPYPNGDLTFWQYFFGIKRQLKSYFRKSYFAQWGENEKTLRTWHWQQTLLPFNRVLRAAVLLLLTGPVGFVFVLLPSFIANHILFAHINYFTHQKQPDGSVKIVNLDSSPAYRALNLLMLGGYSHRNHHDSPSVFNPAKI